MEEKQQTLFKIRDLRKKDQFKIDDKYLNGYARIFGTTTTAVYNSLSRHAEFHTQEAFPSEKLIAEEHNITDRSVRTAIKKLKSANIIKVGRERRNGKWLNNIYSLVDKSEWKSPEEIKDLWLKPEEKNDSNQRKSPEEKIDLLRITKGRITNNKDNKEEKGLVKPTTRQNTNFLKEDYKKIEDTYRRLRKIEPQGQEWLPIQQAIKTMFISKRSVENIIGCMKWLAGENEEWMENWTINTVKMKMPFYMSHIKNKVSFKKYG